VPRAIKGAIIGFGIMLTAGALAFVAPAIFVNATFWTFAQNLALGAFLSGVSAQLAGKNRGARAQTEVEYAGTVEPRRIIYGELLVSGMHVIPPLTSGSNNKMLHVVLAVAGHEVNAIGDVYFGQDLIESADIGSITGAATDGLVSDGDYEDRAWIRRYRGTSTQTADYILNAAFTEWTSDHRGRGVAYIAGQLQYDEEVYKTGKPDLSCMVQGKKCYDPRLDTSPGANPTNVSYIAYTNNPALCLADYLIDDDLGLGEDPARIDWDMVEAAADICDESVDVPTGATQSRYTCNIALLATTPYENNIEALAACMLGSCLYSGGKWRIRAGAWETPSFEITADNVMNGGIQVSTAYPYKERWNGIRGSYIDPDNRYQPNEFPAVQDDDYVTEDGESVFKDMAFSGCTNVYEAQRNAIMLVRKSRNKRSAIIQCDLSAFRIRPGDTGIVTLAELGWTNQQVRCEGWKINPAGSIEIAVREESSDDWNDPLESDYLTPLAISTPAPAYFSPSAPSGLTAEPGKFGVTLSWTAPDLVPTGSHYEVWEYTASTPFASATRVWSGQATSAFIPRSDTSTSYFWVLLRTADGVAGTEYPTAGAGVAGGADNPDADIVTNTVTSVTAAGTNTNAINVTVTEAGKFEIEVSGVLTCTTFSTSGNVIIAFTQSGGTGSFTFTNPSTASYAVTALSQTIRFRHTAVYTTTGSGSWQIRAGWTDDGSGNAYSAANLGLRVTVVRRF
jgi:hypothetical protein